MVGAAAAKGSIDPVRYAHLIEKGHAVRRPKGSTSRESAATAGHVAAHPFEAPGLASGAGPAEEALRSTLKEFIETEASRS